MKTIGMHLGQHLSRLLYKSVRICTITKDFSALDPTHNVLQRIRFINSCLS
jgi:hypothetical protein